VSCRARDIVRRSSPRSRLLVRTLCLQGDVAYTAGDSVLRRIQLDCIVVLRIFLTCIFFFPGWSACWLCNLSVVLFWPATKPCWPITLSVSWCDKGLVSDA
jgi:hypothetical protein